MREKLERLDETFPLEFCPYRKISRGSAYCELSTDPYVNEVDDMVCFNCSVPSILKANDCKHLSIGTQIKAYKSGEKVVLNFSCLAKRRRITLDSCVGCPLYQPGNETCLKMDSREITLEVDTELLNEAVRQIRETSVEVNSSTTIFCPIQRVRGCPNVPTYYPKQVFVAGSMEEDFALLYSTIYQPVLREQLNLQPVRGKLDDFCLATDSLLESRWAIFDLSTPDPYLLVLLGISYGLGKYTFLFAAEGKQAEKAWAPFGILQYKDPQDLARKIKQAMQLGLSSAV